jgi:osmotically-inducible protein OsmY
VDANDGNFTLKGGVPSFFALSSALSDVLTIEGVVDVKNEITVDRPLTISLPSNEETIQRITDLFYLNLNAGVGEIRIEMDDGSVTLEGTVNSYWKKKDAENIARHEPAVFQVINNLTVVPTKGFIDQSLAGDIVGAINRNMLLKTSDIEVKVENGSVTLTGKVTSLVARKAAYDAAVYTTGVKNIYDKLVLTEA